MGRSVESFRRENLSKERILRIDEVSEIRDRSQPTWSSRSMEGFHSCMALLDCCFCFWKKMSINISQQSRRVNARLTFHDRATPSGRFAPYRSDRCCRRWAAPAWPCGPPGAVRAWRTTAGSAVRTRTDRHGGRSWTGWQWYRRRWVPASIPAASVRTHRPTTDPRPMDVWKEGNWG